MSTNSNKVMFTAFTIFKQRQICINTSQQITSIAWLSDLDQLSENWSPQLSRLIHIHWVVSYVWCTSAIWMKFLCLILTICLYHRGNVFFYRQWVYKFDFRARYGTTRFKKCPYACFYCERHLWQNNSKFDVVIKKVRVLLCYCIKHTGVRPMIYSHKRAQI